MPDGLDSARPTSARHARPWTEHFTSWQMARALHSARQRFPAYLCGDFLNDAEMGGPSSSEAWEAAYGVAFHVMGFGQRHALARYMIHAYPDVLHGHA